MSRFESALRYAVSTYQVSVGKQAVQREGDILGKETEGNLFGHTEECAVLIFENDCASLKEEDLVHIFEQFYVKDQSRTS